MTLSEVKEQVERLGERINAPHYLHPTYGRSEDGARPHLELDNTGQLHFVVVERGQEQERRTTTSPDELLFWIFEGITFSMACAFELANRDHREDFRRILFRQQEDLLGRLKPEWQQREVDRHNQLLAQHPFVDGTFDA